MENPSEAFQFGFYFVRHGQTHANRLGIRAGSDSDSALTDIGRCQAHGTAYRLLEGDLPPPSVIYTASNRRTLSTARIINRYFRLKTIVRAGLRERRLGTLNSRSVVLTEAFLVRGGSPFGGESNRAFGKRVLDAISSVAESGHRRPLIVSSRGVARVLFSRIGCQPGDVTNGRLFFVGLAPDDPCRVVSVHDVVGASPRRIGCAEGRRLCRHGDLQPLTASFST